MRSLYIPGNQAAKTPASFPKASRFKHLAKVLPLKEWTDLCTAEFHPPLPANIIGLDTGGDTHTHTHTHTHTLTICFLNLIQIFSRTRIYCIWVILKTGRVRWFFKCRGLQCLFVIATCVADGAVFYIFCTCAIVIAAPMLCTCRVDAPSDCVTNRLSTG